jgi:hypothetical protein
MVHNKLPLIISNLTKYKKNMDTFKKSTEMIIDLQNKNAKLRLGLGKLLEICFNCKMQNESQVWMQQMGFAKQMFDETDPNDKWENTTPFDEEFTKGN